MTNPQPEQPDPYEVELILAAALARVTDEQTAQITLAWFRGWQEVAGDLRDALEVVLAGGDPLNAAAVVRFERLSRTLAAMADILDDLAEMTGVAIISDIDEVLALAEEGTQELIAAQLLEDQELELRPVAPDALTAIVRRTTEQVTSTTLPLADETYSTILRELTRGTAAGDNPRETAMRMVQRSEDLWNFGVYRAINIARTETLDAYREGARVSQDTNADILAGWVWLAHLGPHTCRSCLAMHGEFFSLEEPGPHDHQQGRCSRTPVVKDADGEPDLSWVPDAVDFLTSLPPADQQKILGRRGYQAWLAGNYPPELWVKKRTTPGWRDSYVPAPVPDGPLEISEAGRATRRAVAASAAAAGAAGRS